MTDRFIDLSGVDDHTVRNLEVVTAGATARSNKGCVIIIMNQYARMTDGKTIHAPIQMEHFKLKAQEKAPDVTGHVPTISTIEGYVFPMAIKNGLAYLQQRPFTDKEWDTLPKAYAWSSTTDKPTRSIPVSWPSAPLRGAL